MIMRDFYSSYKDNPKLQPLVGEISWTKNVIIMQRCKDVFKKVTLEDLALHE